MTTTTILLIDPNTICRNAVRQLIERQTSWRVCGQANDMDTGLQLMASRKPHLVMVDPLFSPLTPMTHIKSIRQTYPATRLVIFAAIKSNILVRSIMDAGAHAFILKHTDPRVLVHTLRRVMQGEVCVMPPLPSPGTEKVVASGDYKNFGSVNILSEREWEVFRAIGRGQSTRQIAEQMKLSIKTIESHRAHIKDKLNLENNLALVQAAVKWGGESDG